MAAQLGHAEHYTLHGPDALHETLRLAVVPYGTAGVLELAVAFDTPAETVDNK